MKCFKNILFVKEQNADCETALDRAVTLAQKNQASLTIIDVVEIFPNHFSAIPKGYTSETLLQTLFDERQKQLEQLVVYARKQMNIETRIVSGIPYLEVIRNVLAENYDLVIKPTQNRFSLKERLFGGTDLHLLRKCPVPVWLVKANKAQQNFGIIAAIDIAHDTDSESGNALSRDIIDSAHGLALANHSELHIVHAWQALGEGVLRSGRSHISNEDVDQYVAEEKQRHRKWVEQFTQEVIKQSGKEAESQTLPRIHLPKGLPKDVIPQLAQDLDVDLIVMGTVARVGIPGFFMGNTAEMILNNLDCSVLALKPAGFKTPVSLND